MRFKQLKFKDTASKFRPRSWTEFIPPENYDFERDMDRLAEQAKEEFDDN